MGGKGSSGSMIISRIALCIVTGVAAAALLCSCTSSGSDSAGSTSPVGAVGSDSKAPAGAGTLIPSGPGAGSVGPASDTYSPPASAPFPTPGRDPKKVTDQTAALAALPGSTSSACARVGARTSLRAGGIGMGDFQSAKRSYAVQLPKTEVPQLNFYVIPQHAKKLTTATVRIDPPGSVKASTVRSKQVESADVYSYFVFVLPIRAVGVYTLRVTSGSDQGCFTVAFAK